MKIVFVTNRLTFHQLPLCIELNKYTDEFRLIVCNKIPEGREAAYPPIDEYKKFIIEAYDKTSRKKILPVIENADAVILGSAPDKLIINRLKQRKLTFKYAERLYKGDLTFLQWVRAYIGTYIHYARFKKYNFYVLCSSAYTCADINKFFKFKDRCFKWGYFPETKKYDNIEDIINAKENNSLLWCARLIDWKHPELPVLLAEKLKNEGYNFKLTIIGGGEMEDDIRNLIKEKNLDDFVTMTGAIQPDKVREYMEKAQIFLFTSDSNEGWGAVLNEAMNSCCVCVASNSIGSAPYLIKDGENGFLYKDGNIDDLYKKVTLLLDNSLKCKELGENAYSTITQKWSTKTVVKRFYELSQEILSDNNDLELFEDGPCSPAPILKNNWY